MSILPSYGRGGPERPCPKMLMRLDSCSEDRRRRQRAVVSLPSYLVAMLPCAAWHQSARLVRAAAVPPCDISVVRRDRLELGNACLLERLPRLPEARCYQVAVAGRTLEAYLFLSLSSVQIDVPLSCSLLFPAFPTTWSLEGQRTSALLPISFDVEVFRCLWVAPTLRLKSSSLDASHDSATSAPRSTCAGGKECTTQVKAFLANI